MRTIAGSYIASCNLIANQHGRIDKKIIYFEHDHKAITDLINFFSKKNISDDVESVEELVHYIKTHKNILESALPIAAQINEKAIVSWTAFLTQVNIIDSNNDNFGPHIFNSLEALRWLE